MQRADDAKRCVVDGACGNAGYQFQASSPMQVDVLARSERELAMWDGWVHSRLRHLVARLEPVVLVHPWPVACRPPPVQDQEVRSLAI